MTGKGILNNAWSKERMRVILLQRDGRNCHWCGVRMEWPVGCSHAAGEMTFEHMLRRSEGGGSNRNNLRLACRHCNRSRN